MKKSDVKPGQYYRGKKNPYLVRFVYAVIFDNAFWCDQYNHGVCILHRLLNWGQLTSDPPEKDRIVETFHQTMKCSPQDAIDMMAPGTTTYRLLEDKLRANHRERYGPMPRNEPLPLLDDSSPSGNRPIAEALIPITRAIVNLAIRNNTTLEDFHCGASPRSKTGDFSDVYVVTPYGKIPWSDLSRFGDREMKTLMKAIVNNLATIFAYIDDPDFREAIANNLFNESHKWDEPEKTKLAQYIIMFRK